MPLPPTTAGVPTTLMLGATNFLDDTFVAHPASPTGATVNLNDANPFSLLDTSGIGTGLDWGVLEPSIFDTGNPRTTGRSVVRRTYNSNRVVRITLLWGQGASYPTWRQALTNLGQLCEGITQQQPAALKVQITQSSTPYYLDVIEAHTSWSYHELLTMQMLEEVEITLIARPFWRGARQYLSNLVMNPGFEAPFGGGIATTAPIGFNDTLANVNAYTVQSGSAPTVNPANTYVDVLMANGGANLLRYYRLGGDTSTTAFDIAGTAQHGTLHGSPTQGVAGLISGDTSTCYTFAAASSQYVSTPGTGLPSGNGAVSFGCWFKFAAAPAANATLMTIGTSGTAHQSLNLYVTTVPNLVVDIGGGGASISTAVTAAAIHHAVVTWDGTTLTLYLDGVSKGTATPGAQSVPATPTLNIGANSTPGAYWSGQIDEPCVWNAALNSTQVGNIYTAGNTGATGSVANAMSLPGGTKVAYGSTSWGAIQTQQVRFRWNSAFTTVRFYLHRVDGSNDIEVTASGSSLSLVHRVAGTAHTLATAGSISYIHEAWYWIQITQFPAASGSLPYLTATLSYDQNGTIGTQIAQAAAFTFDAVTALSGWSVLGTDAGTLVVGGVSSGAGVRTYLFGPGTWLTTSGGTGTIACVWEENTANTATLGTLDSNSANVVPVTSFGAARMDFPPAGTFDGAWTTYKGGTPTGTAAIPATVSQVFGLKAVAKSAGLDGTASTRFWVQEWDATGAQLLSTDAIGAVSGNLASWTALHGTYTVTNASCAYISVAVRCGSSNAGSAGATVWFDNVQCWNQSTTGQTTMPYCELRFGNSPAQLLVSGIAGDVAAQALVECGLYCASFPKNTTITLYLGRRAQATANAVLASPGWTYQSPFTFNTLDSSRYGGYYLSTSIGNLDLQNISTQSVAAIPSINDIAGTYEVFSRLWTADVTPSAVIVYALNDVELGSQMASLSRTDLITRVHSPYRYPFTTGSTWLVVDAGKGVAPPANLSSLTDQTATYLRIFTGITGSSSTRYDFRSDFNALVPVDGDIYIASVINPGGANYAVTAQWLYLYADRATSSSNFSVESGPLPAPAHAGGTPGSTASVVLNVNPIGDVGVQVDPTLRIGGGNSVNQFCLLAYDSTATTLPCAVDIVYSPQFLYPQ